MLILNKGMKRAALAVAGVLAASTAWADEDIIAVPTSRPGVTEPVLVVTPPQPAEIAVLLFVGKNGTPDVAKHAGGRGINTLYHNMDVFVREGLTAAVLDVPSDRSSLLNYRTSADHADDIAQAIAALKQRGAKQVWLAGISMGTVSAANAAARLKTGGPDGIVLLSSILLSTRDTWETVPIIPLDAITVPVLLVRNPSDGCKVSPPYGADRIMSGLEHAPIKRLMEFNGGGASQAGPCEVASSHGFIGQEETVLTAIAGWIKTPQP